jgi:succinate dehydrogenase / fumarate reductase cytochrome b subunit
MTQVLAWYRTSIGKKVIVAVTGLILFGYLILHVLGNLQIFAGRQAINAYSAFLHNNPGLLWFARFVLFFSVVMHIIATAQLWNRNRTARDVGYRKRRDIATDYASRTMYYSGPIIAFFVVYHILHLTAGKVGLPFDPHDVYGNLVSGFRIWYVSAVYLISMALLSFHLYHGLWSFFQTLGLSHPKYNRARRTFAQALTAFIFLGFISVPVAILTGLVK